MHVHKHDSDTYQIDGDMHSVHDLDKTQTWFQVKEILGSTNTTRMKDFDFKPNEIVRFIGRIS